MYNICTYCSKDSKNVLDITLSGWAKSEANSIHIYTDSQFDLPIKDKKIFLTPVFPPANDVQVCYTRKAEALEHLLNFNYNNILMIDADCMILNDPGSLFNAPFDVCVSLPEKFDLKKPFNNISAGFCAIKKNKKSVKFVENWITLQNKHWRLKSRDQIALSEILSIIYNKCDTSIYTVSENEYNFYPQFKSDHEIYMWLKKLEQNINNVKIIHLAFQIWKNESLIKYIKNLLMET